MLNQLLPSLLERSILFLAICLAMFAFVTRNSRPPVVDSKSCSRAIRYHRASTWLSIASIGAMLCFMALHLRNY
jgi:hypothetical protein